MATPSQGHYEADDRGKKQRNADEIDGLEHLCDAEFPEESRRWWPIEAAH